MTFGRGRGGLRDVVSSVFFFIFLALGPFRWGLRGGCCC